MIDKIYKKNKRTKNLRREIIIEKIIFPGKVVKDLIKNNGIAMDRNDTIKPDHISCDGKKA